MARKQTVTVRPTYGAGVQWIAANDEPSEHDTHTVGFQVSTLLLADLFGADPERVGVDVVRTRHGAGRWGFKPGEAGYCTDYRCRGGMVPSKEAK